MYMHSMTVLVESSWNVTENFPRMTYSVSSGLLNPTIPFVTYHAADSDSEMLNVEVSCFCMWC